jgi:hypothetical protein
MHTVHSGEPPSPSGFRDPRHTKHAELRMYVLRTHVPLALELWWTVFRMISEREEHTKTSARTRLKQGKHTCGVCVYRVGKHFYSRSCGADSVPSNPLLRFQYPAAHLVVYMHNGRHANTQIPEQNTHSKISEHAGVGHKTSGREHRRNATFTVTWGSRAADGRGGDTRPDQTFPHRCFA